MAYVAPAARNVNNSSNPQAVFQFPADSVANAASATNPTANTAIATITTPAAGVYSVQVWAMGTGTIAAGDAFNMDFRVDGTSIAKMPVPAVANVPVSTTFVMTVNGAQSFTVNAVANASGASAVYFAQLVATKLA